MTLSDQQVSRGRVSRDFCKNVKVFGKWDGNWCVSIAIVKLNRMVNIHKRTVSLLKSFSSTSDLSQSDKLQREMMSK